MSVKKITIATRESDLAITQANWVKQALATYHPDLEIELLGLTTQADKDLTVSVTKWGGKGIFVKELEEALLQGKADIAVHSMKDVPMELPEGLILPVICERVDPHDAFISNEYASLAEMPAGAIIGTSSLRRKLQVKEQQPEVVIAPLRGNIHTRLRRLDQGDFHAIILAAAGLKRLGLESRIRHSLPLTPFIPAAGQGALGVECRGDDSVTQALIAPLNHLISHAEVSAERALCKRIGGGCSVPLAAYAKCVGDRLQIEGYLADPSGNKILRVQAEGSFNRSQEVGERAANKLIEQGALDIIKLF